MTMLYKEKDTVGDYTIHSCLLTINNILIPSYNPLVTFAIN